MNELLDNKLFGTKKNKLSVIMIKKSKCFFHFRYTIKEREIDLSHLSVLTVRTVQNELHPRMSALIKAAAVSKESTYRFYSFGPYFDILFSDLETAILNTHYDYEEKILLENLEKAKKLLDYLLFVTKTEQQAKGEDTHTQIIRAHDMDFAKTDALLSLLAENHIV